MQERFQTFTIYISKINRSIRRIKSKVMSEFNLKAPHVSCIYYLYITGGLTATELCEICDEDKGGISRSIESLQSDGYIKKSVDSTKRYKSPLTLTEKGNEVGEFLCEKIDKVLLDASQGISDEDRACLYKGLGVISKNLEELAKNGKTVIISTHIMSLAQKLCQRVGIIIKGKMVICDTLENILNQYDSNDLEDVFFELYKKEEENDETRA